MLKMATYMSVISLPLLDDLPSFSDYCRILLRHEGRIRRLSSTIFDGLHVRIQSSIFGRPSFIYGLLPDTLAAFMPHSAAFFRHLRRLMSVISCPLLEDILIFPAYCWILCSLHAAFGGFLPPSLEFFSAIGCPLLDGHLVTHYGRPLPSLPAYFRITS